MADADSLESLEYQLKTINESLAEDPGNKDMLELKAEMENLINLTREYTKTSTAPSGSTAPRNTNAHASTSKASGSSSHAFTAGTVVLAKWQRDGKMYPARIASVSGSTSDPVYTVIFDVDKSTEVVRSGDIKAMSESRKRAYAAGPSTSADTGDDKESKKQKKVEKKVAKEEDRKARVAEQAAKQSTWQNFAKKGAKKGISIPGVNGTSMFKSPDTVTGRVGVVGSGKGMTTSEQKKRYKLGETLDE